jgi:aldehyde dehydrogenase (NAD+)
MNNIEDVFNKQRIFFRKGSTLELDFRLDILKKLKTIIKQRESDILSALYSDLHKSEFECYSTEIYIVLNEINYAIKNLKKWIRPTRVKQSIFSFPSKNYIFNEPYGNSLIIGPWNYPFQLTLHPIIGAIAAGNTCIIKPSEISVNSSKLITEIINSNFNDELLACFEGGSNVSQNYLI